jgi:hypothetical protein
MDPFTLLTGLFGGAVSTAAWELGLSPFRQRRRLAETLSAEVSHNIQVIAAALVRRTPRLVPSDFSVSTMVFDATVAEIGVLPSHLIGEVVLLYRHFAELNKMRDMYSEAVRAIRDLPAGSRLEAQLRNEAQEVIDHYNAYLETVADRVYLVQPLLLSTAFPLWSVRRWTRKPSKTLPLEDAAKRAKQSLDRRDEINKRLRGNSDHR